MSALCIALIVGVQTIRRAIVLSPGGEHVSGVRKQALAAVVVGVSDRQNCTTMPAVARKEAGRCAVHATSIADTAGTGLTSQSIRAIAAWQRKRGVLPRRAALLGGFSSSDIDRYVAVILPRTGKEGKLRVPLRLPAYFEREGKGANQAVRQNRLRVF